LKKIETLGANKVLLSFITNTEKKFESNQPFMKCGIKCNFKS